MTGHIKNLKNVYRTPSNIAKCAFEILAEDNALNDYYKKSHYLSNGFLSDINFILDDGSLNIGNWDDANKLRELLGNQKDECILLTPFKGEVQRLEGIVASLGKSDAVKVMTMQSIKGLEAKSVILYNFDEFLRQSLKYDTEIFYRKIYVLLTRALENIYISVGDLKDEEDERVRKVLSILEKYKIQKSIVRDEDKITLAKLGPIMEKGKIAVDAAVIAKDIFSLVAGLLV